MLLYRTPSALDRPNAPGRTSRLARVPVPDPLVATAAALLVGTLAVLVFIAFVASSSAARGGLHCGAVVTHSARLDRDIVGCKFTGLTVARSGVTLDLAGHTVGGTGEAVGIRMRGVRGVTIRNGTVRGFELGMLARDIRRSRIAGIRILDSDDRGLRIVGARHSVFRGVELDGNSDLGMSLLSSHRNRLIGLSLGTNGDAGIQLESSNRNSIRNSRMTRNGDAGIKLLKSNRNRVLNLTLVGSGDAGILLDGSHFNRVRANRAVASSDSGIGIDKSSGNLVVGNSVRSNGEGITVDGGTGNRILRNRATFNGGAGIEISSESPETRVRGNATHCNGGDGIYVEGVHTHLAGNRATCNGGMGIKAVVPRVYVARNWAGQNSDNAGCMGVDCAPMASPYRDCKQAKEEESKRFE